MFQKLHKKMTLFCVFVTGFILVALSFTCLFFAESNMKRNNYASFLKEVNTIILHLQGENAISHQWLNQLHDNSNFQIYLYDNGQELFYQQLHASTSQEEKQQKDLLLEKVTSMAETNFQLNIFQSTSSLFPVHEEFSLKDEQKQSYYVSAGVIPKSDGDLSFILLLPLNHQERQILSLRLFITIADMLGIILLSVFSWFFTGKMLIPLEENRKKQTQFVASASHELRTPLTVIMSALEALKKADSREEKLHFEKIMAEEMLCDCTCDTERMIQVFSILMDNALSYTPEGGSVTLSLKSVSSGKFFFSVADTGSGIDDSEKKLVFERFYRSDNARTDKEHFGLGLCIAKEIIYAHRGKIWIEDNNPQGTVFLIEL